MKKQIEKKFSGFYKDAIVGYINFINSISNVYSANLYIAGNWGSLPNQITWHRPLPDQTIILLKFMLLLYN